MIHNWCVLIEISMEIGMLNFWLPLLVTAQTKENYFTIFLKNQSFFCPQKVEKKTHSKVDQKNSYSLFSLLPWLPKWPKQKNSCSQMWPIDQLYIELGFYAEMQKSHFVRAGFMFLVRFAASRFCFIRKQWWLFEFFGLPSHSSLPRKLFLCGHKKAWADSGSKIQPLVCIVW